MIAIVITTATENEALTAKELEALGYRRQDVWLKFGVDGANKAVEEQKLFDAGVAQFIVGDYWGRGNPD
jgi:hypothetical protein